MIWLDSLYYSIRNDFLSSFQTVLSVKHKIKALLFRVLIYEGLREFIWHDSLSSPGPIAVSKKNQPINELVYVIRMRARRLFLFFNSFSPNMLEMKKLIRDYKINKSLSGLLVYRRIMPLAKRFSSKFHICPRKLFIFLSTVGIILRYTSRRKGFIY